jgi:hypothetical protein
MKKKRYEDEFDSTKSKEIDFSNFNLKPPLGSGNLKDLKKLRILLVNKKARNPPL